MVRLRKSLDRATPRAKFNHIIKRHFAPRWTSRWSREVLLVEIINNPPHQIAIAHLVKALTKGAPLRVVAFVDPANTGLNPRQAFQQDLRFRARSWRSKNTESTYVAMGVKAFIYPAFSHSQRTRAESTAREFFAMNPTKWDVEEYRLDGILIGDLIYDDYLLKLQRGTVEPESLEFREHFTESLKVFFFWKDYFASRKVRAVIANSVYRQAIVARIAIASGCEAFDAQLSRVVRLSGDGYQFEDTRTYKSEFAKIGDKDNALELARQALALKRGGKPDLSNSHLAAPSGNRSRVRVLNQTPIPKILITPHCFSDSAHAFGKMLFPDFQEWLTFLASIAKNSSYEWYLKPHPRGTEDLPIIRQIFSTCPNVIILEHDASLDQLGEEGVTVALTMRGHIGFDFPLMGIPVISCTPGYRYRNYDFNVQVDDIEEYRSLLSEVESVPRSILDDELAEFYFMDTILNHPNLFFPDLLDAQQRSAGLGPEGILSVFADTVDENFIELTLSQLEDFIHTSELRFRRFVAS